VKLTWAPRLSGHLWSPTSALLADWERLAGPVGRSAWICEVAWVDDLAMAALNGRFRRQPGVTDVLSFSELTANGTGRPALAAGEGWAARDLFLEELVSDPQVGSLVLAPLFITERCRDNGWDPAAELRLLVAHGLLHVVGWEHDDPPHRRAMRLRERELLARIGRSHPLPVEER